MERPALGRSDCGGAPPSRATVYSRTLQRACEVLGGVEQLAQQLGVPPADLVRWIDARAQPPLEIFLQAVDTVLLHADRPRGSS